MKTKMQPLRAVGVKFVLYLSLVSCPAWSDVLKGTVTDFGAPAGNNGIAGVSLTVRNVKSAELITGLTNARGEYSVQFPRQKNGVQVSYEKLGFQPRPEVKWVANPDSPQQPVILLREGADDGYYQTVADAMGNAAAGTDPEYLQGSAAAVAALSENDRARVLNFLNRAAGKNAVIAIRTAEADAAISERVRAAIIAEPSVRDSGINVNTFKGEVQLSGFVSIKPSVERKAIELARGVKGVKSVKNDMRTK